MHRIAVVGAGIVGASVAFWLARSEAARVWIVDKARPGSGTTSTSLAWVNANAKKPREYFELNRAGLEEHFRLQDDLPGGAPWLYPGGSLEWAGDEEALAELRSRAERLRSWGYAAEWWEASRVNELLEPHIAFTDPDTPVAFFPEEAWVDAPRLANVLVDLARQYGAEVRFDTPAEFLEVRGERVAALHLEGGERLVVDSVVNAAGSGAGRVAELLGLPLPLVLKEGFLLRLAVSGSPLRRLIHSPRVNIRPDGPEHVLVHHASIDEEFENGTGENLLCSRLLELARPVVPMLENAKVEEVRVGTRPVPEDGLSCVGALPAVPGYYEAVTHSGVTLGPLVGRLLAKEILRGEVDPLVSPFRPDRFDRG